MSINNFVEPEGMKLSVILHTSEGNKLLGEVRWMPGDSKQSVMDRALEMVPEKFKEKVNYSEYIPNERFIFSTQGRVD